jgi:hypothetical protein
MSAWLSVALDYWRCWIWLLVIQVVLVMMITAAITVGRDAPVSALRKLASMISCAVVSIGTAEMAVNGPSAPSAGPAGGLQ